MKLRTIGLVLGLCIGAAGSYARAEEVKPPEMIVLSVEECEQVAYTVMREAFKQQTGHVMEEHSMTANSMTVLNRIYLDNPRLLTDVDPGEAYGFLLQGCVNAGGRTDIPVAQ